jgi:thioredoxin-related protein
MKTYMALIMVFGFLNLSVTGQGKEKIRWYNFEEAVELSSRNPKKILVDIYTDWCGFCKQMDAITFSNEQVAKYINEHYYAVKFNSETTDTIFFQGHQFINEGNGRRSAHQLSIALLQGKMSYPSVVYIDKDLALLTAVPGFRKPDQIEPILRFFAEGHYKDKSWEDYMESFVGTFK